MLKRVSGSVKAANGEPLPLAGLTVLTSDGQTTGRGSAADVDGVFVDLPVEVGEKIRATYIGFSPVTKEVTTSNNYHFKLGEQPVELEGAAPVVGCKKRLGLVSHVYDKDKEKCRFNAGLFIYKQPILSAGLIWGLMFGVWILIKGNGKSK